jgi:amidase
VTAQTCVDARQQATSIAQAAINDTRPTNHLDAIIAPTNGPAWVTDPVNGDLGGDSSTFVGSSSPSAIAGYASITVPAGFVGPLPIGVSFIGGCWSEPRLIGLAYALEQATHVRVPPQFLASTTAAAATHGAATNGERRAVVPSRSGQWTISGMR